MNQTLKMPPVIHSMALRIMVVRYQVGLLVVVVNGYDRVNRIQSKPEHALEPEEILQLRNAFNAHFSHSLEKLQLRKCNYWHKQLNCSMWTCVGWEVGRWWDRKWGGVQV